MYYTFFSYNAKYYVKNSNIVIAIKHGQQVINK